MCPQPLNNTAWFLKLSSLNMYWCIFEVAKKKKKKVLWNGLQINIYWKISVFKWIRRKIESVCVPLFHLNPLQEVNQ